MNWKDFYLRTARLILGFVISTVIVALLLLIRTWSTPKCDTINILENGLAIAKQLVLFMHLAISCTLWVFGFLVFIILSKRIISNRILLIIPITILCFSPLVLDIFENLNTENSSIERGICKKSNSKGSRHSILNLNINEYKYFSQFPVLPKTATNINVYYKDDRLIGESLLQINFINETKLPISFLEEESKWELVSEESEFFVYEYNSLPL